MRPHPKQRGPRHLVAPAARPTAWRRHHLQLVRSVYSLTARAPTLPSSRARAGPGSTQQRVGVVAVDDADEVAVGVGDEDPGHIVVVEPGGQ